MNRTITLLVSLLYSFVLAAQTGGPQMADTFRQEGKIYVVIAVIAVIFVSLLVFLVYIERKVSRIEKKMDKLNQHNQ